MNYVLKFYPVLLVLLVFVGHKLEWAKGGYEKIYILLLLALITMYVLLLVKTKKGNAPLFAVYAVVAALLLLLVFNVL